MILADEFFGNNIANDHGCPDAGLESVSNRTTFNNIGGLFQLGLIKSGGSPAPMAFKQCRFTMFIPTTNPIMHPSTMDSEVVRNRRWCLML